jgi:hypothetical protein
MDNINGFEVLANDDIKAFIQSELDCQEQKHKEEIVKLKDAYEGRIIVHENKPMTIDQNILISVQAGKISSGRAKELIEAEIQKELEELAKELLSDAYGYDITYSDIKAIFASRGITLGLNMF